MRIPVEVSCPLDDYLPGTPEPLDGSAHAMDGMMGGRGGGMGRGMGRMMGGQVLRIETDTSLPALRVIRVLKQLEESRGLPAMIRVDNG